MINWILLQDTNFIWTNCTKIIGDDTWYRKAYVDLNNIVVGKLLTIVRIYAAKLK
jgi:hypothetical protein